MQFVLSKTQYFMPENFNNKCLKYSGFYFISEIKNVGSECKKMSKLKLTLGEFKYSRTKIFRKKRSRELHLSMCL